MVGPETADACPPPSCAPTPEREDSVLLPLPTADSTGRAQEELDGLRRALAEGEVHDTPAVALQRAVRLRWLSIGLQTPRASDLLFRFFRYGA